MTTEEKKPFIWILEDDEGSRFVYEEILGLRYRLRMFDRVAPFLEALGRLDKEEHPTLIVADLRLPDDTFITLLSKESSRSLLSNHPFLVVSSVDDIDILRLCFKEGALDYITKPFGKNEFLVKVERLLMRRNSKESGAGAELCHIDPIAMTVSCASGEAVSLTSKEFQILTLLTGDESRSVSREDLITRIWNRVMVNAKTVDIHIYNLRKKLDPLGITIEFKAPDVYSLSTSGKRVDP